MKRTIKTRLIAAAMALLLAVALSAAAFADGPQGGPPQEGFGQNRQNEGLQGDMQMNNGPQGGPPRDNFDQNDRLPPEKPEGDEDRIPPADGGNLFNQNGPMDGQQPPEKPEGEEDRTPPADDEYRPMVPGGQDPMNQIISAVNELEDEELKANIENLMAAHRDAMDAERNAEDDDARAEAAEAVAVAQEALNEALAAAGIEVAMEAPAQNGQQPPERPDGTQPPETGQLGNSQQPPEKPEGDARPADPQQQTETTQEQVSLFRQFLEWLKNNEA